MGMLTCRIELLCIVRIIDFKNAEINKKQAAFRFKV